MHRIGAIILIAILLGLGWVVLDWSGDSTPDGTPPAGPERPTETGGAEDPNPETPETPEPPPDTPVSVTGTVLAPGGGRAPGARVRPVALGEDWWPVDPEPRPEVRADAVGRFRIHGLEPGHYRIEARTDDGRGYLPVVPVRDGLPTTVLVRLSSIASISGSVVTEAGVPVPGAKVSADLGGVLRSVQASAGGTNEERSGQFEAVTDRGGHFVLGDLPVGQYEIRVESKGHAPRRVFAVNAPVKGIRIEVLDTFEVWGSVDWAGEKAPASIRLGVEPLGLSTTIDTDEHPAPFTISGVTRGEHTFLAVAPDHGMAEARFAVQPGSGTGPVRLTLERGRRVWLTVKTRPRVRTPAEVEVWRVRRSPAGEGLRYLATFPIPKTGRHGIYLTPGEWDLRGRAPGYVDTRKRRLVVDSDVEYLDIDLVPAAAVSGRVTWPSGWPARDVEVEIGDVKTLTDSNGAYRREGLPLDRTTTVEVGSQTRTVIPTAKRPEVRADFVLGVSGTGTVRGQVISDENEPVPGATVFFRDGFAVTDMDGRFERKEVAAGPHDLRFFAPGYGLGFRSKFLVERGRTVEVPIMVLPWRASRVEGRVLGPNDTPVAGARVRVWFPGLVTPLETRTGPGGWFVQEGPAIVEGQARIEVDAEGIGIASRSVVARSDPDPVTLRLERPGRLRISLGGKAPQAFRLEMRLRGRMKSGDRLPTDRFFLDVPSGVDHVYFDDLPPGSYSAEFRIGKQRLKARNRSFRLQRGETAEVGPLWQFR